jgi:hypothetical protein
MSSSATCARTFGCRCPRSLHRGGLQEARLRRPADASCCWLPRSPGRGLSIFGVTHADTVRNARGVGTRSAAATTFVRLNKRCRKRATDAGCPHCLSENRRQETRITQEKEQDRKAKPTLRQQRRRSAVRGWPSTSRASGLVASEIALLHLLGRRRRHASLQMLIDRRRAGEEKPKQIDARPDADHSSAQGRPRHGRTGQAHGCPQGASARAVQNQRTTGPENTGLYRPQVGPEQARGSPSLIRSLNTAAAGSMGGGGRRRLAFRRQAPAHGPLAGCAACLPRVRPCLPTER